MKDTILEIISGLSEDAQHEIISAIKHSEIEHSGLPKEEIEAIFNQAKRDGSLKDSCLSHAESYGIKNIELLFQDPKSTGEPELLNKKVEWVAHVIANVSKQPFARIKTLLADISVDTAKAKGYITAARKKEDVFGLLKRVTDPTTVYKKQKLDRDDIVDITDFDAVAWIKSIMRQKLDETVARSILIGDGRLNSDADKVDEECIRPIINDVDLYSVKVAIDNTADNIYEEFINSCIKSRKLYRGSGTPTLYTTEDLIGELLLLKDANGRRIYKSEEEIKSLLRVKEIVTVSDMLDAKRTAEDSETKDHNIMAIIVNLVDYAVGTNKNGKVTMFDDFDIDYNQQKYLIEVRCSGALIKPYSAIVIENITNKAAVMEANELEEEIQNDEI